jgi:hypothetical protein
MSRQIPLLFSLFSLLLFLLINFGDVDALSISRETTTSARSLKAPFVPLQLLQGWASSSPSPPYYGERWQWFLCNVSVADLRSGTEAAQFGLGEEELQQSQVVYNEGLLGRPAAEAEGWYEVLAVEQPVWNQTHFVGYPGYLQATQLTPVLALPLRNLVRVFLFFLFFLFFFFFPSPKPSSSSSFSFSDKSIRRWC